MAVCITGDTHGEMDMGKIDVFALGEGARLTRDDYLIVLGDFGLVWGDPPSGSESARLDWLDSRPWTTLFVDGNHENFDMLDTLPVETWKGGRVQRVRPNVLRLMRGETFDFGGHSFFVVGGAHSIDRQWRKPHVTWWVQETPNDEERNYIAAQARGLEHVDYVLTHCPPTGQYERYRVRFPQFWGPSDEWTDWLEEHVEGQFSYERWLFGHLHMDLPDDPLHTALFNAIVCLDEV